MIKRKYTVRPDGVQHGTELRYDRTGTLIVTAVYDNGAVTSYKTHLKDGSIGTQGNLIEVKNEYDTEPVYSNYQYYKLNSTGQKGLAIKSVLYKQTLPDSIGDLRVPITYQNGSKGTLWLNNYRLESYTINRNDGSRLIFESSPDHKYETIKEYNVKNECIYSITYDVKNETISFNTIIGETWELKSGTLTLKKSIPIIIDGKMYHCRPATIKCENTKKSVKRKEFYNSILWSLRCSITDYPLIAIQTYDNYQLSDFLNDKINALDKVFKGRVFSIADVRTKGILTLVSGNEQCGKYEYDDSSMKITATYENGYYSKFDVVPKVSYRFFFSGSAIETIGSVGWIFSETEDGHASYVNGLIPNVELTEGILTQGQYKYNGKFKNMKLHGAGSVKCDEYLEKFYISGIFENGKCIKVDSIGLSNSPIKKLEKINDHIRLYSDSGAIYEGEPTEDNALNKLCEIISIKIPDYYMQGKYTAPNGEIYEGTFQKKSFQELNERYKYFFIKGKVTYTNGDYKIGKFDYGKINAGDLITARISLTNGEVYEGEMLNNEYNGNGCLTKPNGDYDKGSFMSNKFSGTGEVRRTNPNGDVYCGAMLDNEYHGQGVYTLANGDKCEGNFVSGSLPFGTITFKNGNQYKGDLVNYMPNGRGEYFYKKSNSIYIGSFQNGVKEGEGVITSNNISYKGTWSNDAMTGIFTVLDNGDAYNIHIKAGSFSDKVTIIYKNGDKYIGVVKDGQYVKGKYVFNNGESFEGSWIDNKPNKGKLRDKQGAIIKKPDHSAYNYTKPNVLALQYPI